MAHAYGFEGLNKSHAKAVELSAPISSKVAVEVCRALSGMDYNKALMRIARVQSKQEPIKFGRYKKGGVGARAKVGPARYPIKAAAVFAKLLKTVGSNAESVGLNKNNLKIVHIASHKGAKQRHYGRTRGTLMKRTTIEVVVGERK